MQSGRRHEKSRKIMGLHVTSECLLMDSELQPAGGDEGRSSSTGPQGVKGPEPEEGTAGQESQGRP